MSEIEQFSISGSAAARRMRLYRERRRRGLRSVRIPLHVTEVGDLIRLGILKGEKREDPEALRDAVLNLIRRALDDMRWWPATARPSQ
jgi:hypothetical protein